MRFFVIMRVAVFHRLVFMIVRMFSFFLIMFVMIVLAVSVIVLDCTMLMEFFFHKSSLYVKPFVKGFCRKSDFSVLLGVYHLGLFQYRREGSFQLDRSKMLSHYTSFLKIVRPSMDIQSIKKYRKSLL